MGVPERDADLALINEALRPRRPLRELILEAMADGEARTAGEIAPLVGRSNQTVKNECDRLARERVLLTGEVTRQTTGGARYPAGYQLPRAGKRKGKR